MSYELYFGVCKCFFPFTLKTVSILLIQQSAPMTERDRGEGG